MIVHPRHAAVGAALLLVPLAAGAQAPAIAASGSSPMEAP